MQIIPLAAVPSQSVLVNLNGQQTQINVYQKQPGVSSGYGPATGFLLADVYLNNVPLVTGVLCLNKALLVIDSYFGFVGDLAFVDQQAETDPVYTGLGSQYLLYYLEASDLALAAA